MDMFLLLATHHQCVFKCQNHVNKSCNKSNQKVEKRERDFLKKVLYPYDHMNNFLFQIFI